MQFRTTVRDSIRRGRLGVCAVAACALVACIAANCGARTGLTVPDADGARDVVHPPVACDWPPIGPGEAVTALDESTSVQDIVAAEDAVWVTFRGNRDGAITPVSTVRVGVLGARLSAPVSLAGLTTLVRDGAVFLGARATHRGLAAQSLSGCTLVPLDARGASSAALVPIVAAPCVSIDATDLGFDAITLDAAGRAGVMTLTRMSPSGATRSRSDLTLDRVAGPFVRFARNADGSFLLVSSTMDRLQVRQFAQDGTPLTVGGSPGVTPLLPSRVTGSDIAMTATPDGPVLAWQPSPTSGDASPAIVVVALDRAGSLRAPPTVLTGSPRPIASARSAPSVTYASGDVLVTWFTDGRPGRARLLLQPLLLDGTPRRATIDLGEYDAAGSPHIVATSSGVVIVFDARPRDNDPRAQVHALGLTCFR